MSEENKPIGQEATVPSSSVDVPATEPKTMFGIPLDMFVRGGTTSMRHDNLMAQHRVEDEQRRNEADEERRIAARKNTGPGDVAKLHTMNLGTPSQHPVVLLDFVSPKGEVLMDKGKPMQMLAEVYVGDNFEDPTDLTLNMACPYCVSRGTPQGRAQFKVRQSHRPWHLDVSKQGEFFKFEGAVYRSAGVIMESTKLRCPYCNWTFRIDKNKIREDV